MNRRTFIISTTSITAALAAPGVFAAEEELQIEQLCDYQLLKARFVKIPNDISAHSYWEVFAKSGFEKYKLLFRVSVNDIILADPNQSYSTISDWKFGNLILKSIRNKGLERTKAILGVYGNLRGLADDDPPQYRYVAENSSTYQQAKCLAQEFYRKGLIEESGIDKQTMEILKWNEEAFLQVKKAVEKLGVLPHVLPKTA